MHTEGFANGYLTRIQGKLFDRGGKIRMEPLFDGIRYLETGPWRYPVGILGSDCKPKSFFMSGWFANTFRSCPVRRSSRFLES